MRVKLQHEVDHCYGPFGYLPRSHRKRLLGETTFPNRQLVKVRIDFGVNWFVSKKAAKLWKKNSFETFLDGLIMVTLHEFYHAFEPLYTRYRKAERGADLFAYYGLMTRKRKGEGSLAKAVWLCSFRTRRRISS